MMNVDVLLFGLTAGAYRCLFLRSKPTITNKADSKRSIPVPPVKEKVLVPRKEPSLTNLAELSQQVSLVKNFPCLADSLTKAPVLGLYFAASWCPDCDDVTPALAKIVNNQDATEKLVHIVYVSSDRTEKEMQDYKPSCFGAVPWDSEERSALKHHFGTCPGKEREALGMSLADRKHGIPTLILLDANSGLILTEDAAQEVQTKKPDQLLEEWKAMCWELYGNESWETIQSAHYRQKQM
jgi:nucleoredoxin